MQKGEAKAKEKKLTFMARLGELVYDSTPRPRLLHEGWLRLGILFGLAFFLYFVRGKSKLLTTLCQALLWLMGLLAYFYRNPAREIGNASSEHIYAPCDGKVISVDQVSEPSFISGKVHRIVIESNLLDAHLYRAPLGGQLRYIFSEAKPAPHLYLGIARKNGDKVLLSFEQKSSFWRLPVFLGGTPPTSLRVEAGANLSPGQPIGVSAINLGSRITLYLPATPDIHLFCIPGMPMRAGMSILARFYPE